MITSLIQIQLMPEEIENGIGLSRLWFSLFSIVEEICGSFALLEKVYSSLNKQKTIFFQSLSNDVKQKTKLICICK